MRVETLPKGAWGMIRLLSNIISFRQDWFGEWRLFLFGNYTNLCFMDPREWGRGWCASYRKTRYNHGQTIRGVRLLGFDYCCSTFDEK